MKRLLFVLLIAVAGVVGISALPGDTSAGAPVLTWSSLSETCHDTNGDGLIDLPNDILSVIQRHNTVFGGPPNPYTGLEYSLVYDVKGPNEPGGTIDMPNDILSVILAHGTTCSLIDTQVVAATVAVMKYDDPAVAFADGYAYGGQYIGNMGIHLINSAYQVTYTTFYDPVTGEDQLRHPVGLVYSETFPGSMVPDVFLGPWYNIAVPPVCDFYSMPGPCQDVNVQPVGFGATNTDEDNQDPPGIQASWHEHFGLCVAGWGTVNAMDYELGPNTEQECYDPPYNGDVWFSVYGWMMHLYSFVPNPDGRFMLWNVNPDLP